jgi:hypothetical protein
MHDKLAELIVHRTVIHPCQTVLPPYPTLCIIDPAP